MEQHRPELYNQLLKVEEEEGQHAWRSFLYNVEAARSLGPLSHQEAMALLSAGHRWAGGGWTTSRASRALHSLTGIPLIAAEVSSYRDAWLYALSMHFNVDVPSLELSDRSSEAAFALASLLSGEEEDEEEPPREAQQHDEESEEETEVQLSWDEQLLEL